VSRSSNEQDKKQADVIFPATDAEARCLELQAELYGGTSFLDPFLSSKPRAILDVGCGSGHFTRLVAQASPTATICGVDREASRLCFARACCGADNLRYEQADMAALPFADESFDLVYCRFVLVHDRDPSGALREMARVTRPGGAVVAYDMVHEGIWLVPERPAFAQVLQTIVAILRESGAEPNQGLHLTAGLQRAGLADVAAQVIPYHALATDTLYAAYCDNWSATLQSLAKSLGTRLDPALVRAAVSEVERTTGDEFLVETTVLAWGRKR
jgi:ubiquinone/menaquinone biosynthesis C-methylase UbiE